MATANFMNVSSVNGNYSVRMDASKKLQEENLEVAEMFAGLMNQTLSATNAITDDTSSDMDISKTSSTQSPVESYERYSYKDKQIDTAQETIEDDSEVLEEASEQIIDTLCEKYGVDEETLKNLLEDMGLGVLDLLNPQNLVSFVVQLTGLASGEELLLDETFLSVMETVNHLAQEVMDELNVDMAGLKELITDASVEETLITDVSVEEALVTEVNSETEEPVVEESEVNVSQEVLETTVETDALLNDSASQNSNQNFNTNEAVVQTQTLSNVSQVSDSVPTQQFSSYLSADSVQIIEQIVQQMRVTISNEVKTMEMQMNPENLGKVYVNISSEEGVVNAQFHATNEVVKEALEAQIATLRENLTQAGVKVDAIEVTIASHEFERNLEENHQNPDEQMQEQEVETKKRRNLNLDSLDELAGVMTEEETLVAQIMKDNGNSVDFTA